MNDSTHIASCFTSDDPARVKKVIAVDARQKDEDEQVEVCHLYHLSSLLLMRGNER